MYMNLKDYPTLHLDKLVKEGAAFINAQHPTGPIISKTHTSKPRTSVTIKTTHIFER
jgi:hypothetical protein